MGFIFAYKRFFHEFRFIFGTYINKSHKKQVSKAFGGFLSKDLLVRGFSSKIFQLVSFFKYIMRVFRSILKNNIEGPRYS